MSPNILEILAASLCSIHHIVIAILVSAPNVIAFEKHNRISSSTALYVPYALVSSVSYTLIDPSPFVLHPYAWNFHYFFLRHIPMLMCYLRSLGTLQFFITLSINSAVLSLPKPRGSDNGRFCNCFLPHSS